MPTIDELREAALRLAERRQYFEAIDQKIKAAEQACRDSIADDLYTAQQWRRAVEEAESAARALVVAWFTSTGDRAPGFGLSVQERTVVELTDEAAVLAWAQAHAPDLLKVTIDTKALAKVLGSVIVPGAHLAKLPTAVVSTNLASHIAETDARLAEQAAEVGQ